MEKLDHYDEEVSRGARFEFGKNWARFLRVLNDERMAIAERSVEEDAQRPSASTGRPSSMSAAGSGLFSLVARRTGAKVSFFRLRSPVGRLHDASCKRRHFPGDPNWTIVQRIGPRSCITYDGLGTFDIVYSWGVLHHTGQMWQALDNVKPLVARGGPALHRDLQRSGRGHRPLGGGQTEIQFPARTRCYTLRAGHYCRRGAEVLSFITFAAPDLAHG